MSSASSQMPLHAAAEAIRAWCLSDCEWSEAERGELLRNQVEGEISTEAAIKARHSADDRQEIRQAWNTERARIFTWRDALTIGLAWPHRGELVTVSTWWCGGDGQAVSVTGAVGVYLNSYDTHKTAHQVWVPALSADPNVGTRLVRWEPHEHWGNAVPGRDISMRVAGAESRRLPVPLPRWPKPDDIAGGIDPLLRKALATDAASATGGQADRSGRGGDGSVPRLPGAPPYQAAGHPRPCPACRRGWESSPHHTVRGLSSARSPRRRSGSYCYISRRIIDRVSRAPPGPVQPSAEQISGWRLRRQCPRQPRRRPRPHCHRRMWRSRALRA